MTPRSNCVRWLIFLLCVTTAACNGSSTSPSENAPYIETVNGSVVTFGTTRHALNIPRSGEMRLTLTWAAGTIDLDLYLASSACQELYPQEQCGIVGTSDASVGTREVITRTVSSGQTYAIFVDNFSTVSPSTYTLEIRID